MRYLEEFVRSINVEDARKQSQQSTIPMRRVFDQKSSTNSDCPLRLLLNDRKCASRHLADMPQTLRKQFQNLVPLMVQIANQVIATGQT